MTVKNLPVFAALIKPASGRCNMRCAYCFYRSETAMRQVNDYGIMSGETAERLIDRAFETGAETYSFAFQGGEPLLAGLDFYEFFTSKVKERAPKSAGVSYALQTNGTLINREWAQFFKKNNFLIGLSLDGPRLLHDTLRPFADGRESFRSVFSGFEVLRATKVPVNALCVVNKLSADNPEPVYSFLSRYFDWIQFIPCIDPIDAVPGENTWHLSPAAYRNFLIKTFDLWHKDIVRGKRVHVRYFNNLLDMLLGYAPEYCGMSGVCGIYFTVEADGSVYPCDFYALDQWKLGNVEDSSFSEMLDTEKARSFLDMSRYVSPECRDCTEFSLCHGGCRRDREPSSEGKPALNRYCAAFKGFFNYAKPFLEQIAATLQTAPQKKFPKI
jgi:uncharacterized protein